MNRTPAVAIWLCAAALFCPGAVRAQSGTVAAVKVTGSKKFPGEQIATLSGLAAGATVTRDDIQAAADRLAQLGPFANVQFRFRSRGEEVEIEFQLEDAPTLPVSFDNFPWLTDAQIHEALRQAIAFFDGTAPEQGALLDLMKETLERQLAAQNVKGVVEYSPLGRPDGPGMMMQFRLAGAALKISGIQFSHPLAGDDRRVRERLSDLAGKAYSRFLVEVFLREQVRPVYLERGHLQVKFGEPEARFTGDPARPLSDQVLVVVPIEAGPVCNWALPEWVGNIAFGPDALNSFLGLAPGEVANGVRIQAGLDRVTGEYGRSGYLDAKLDAQPLYSTGGTTSHPVVLARYRIAITEGLQYRMGEMVIAGLSLTAERRLLAAWRIPPGEVFNRVYLEELLRTLETRRDVVFGDLPLHYDTVGHLLRTNPQARTVDLLLDFK